MSETGVCPLCHRSARVQALPSVFADKINCEKCGEYILESGLRETNYWDRLRLRSALYYYLTQQADSLRERNIIPHFYDGSLDEAEGQLIPLRSKFRKLMAVTPIEDLYPRDYDDRISMIMVNLANEVQFIGNTFTVRQNGDPDKSHLFFLDESYGTESYKLQLDGMLAMLEKLGLIEATGIKPAVTGKTQYNITPRGWQRVQEYQKAHKTLPQGFIAMWFDPSMKPIKERIIEAIRDSGYLPMVIDMKEHNNQIVPEILFEIDRSEFVVADLTGGRGGVYYEAGYASGRDKPVIMCCRDDYFNQIHFDLKQKNGINWTDEDDLYKRLTDRIQATIGKRPTAGGRCQT